MRLPEGSPMAKPEPTVPVKARPINLILHSPWSTRENPSQNLGCPVNPENDDKGQGDLTCTRKLVPQNPEVERSQVKRQENAQCSDSWKQHNQEEASRSTSSRNLVQAANSRTKFRNMQYMTEIFHFLQKLGITEAYSTSSMAALKINILIWTMFMSSSMKAAIHPGPNYLANLEVYKNTNFEEIQSLFSITQQLILEHSEEILNVDTIESTSTSWTRSVLSHDQVIQWTKAKSTCQLRFRSMLGKVQWKQRCNHLMKRSSGRIKRSRDAIEFEWNILSGFSTLQILQKNPR